jgi:hypothetical protein
VATIVLTGLVEERSTRNRRKQSIGVADNAGSLPGTMRVGLTRIELVTSALSVLRSNQLSYSPANRLLTLHHDSPKAAVGRRAYSGPDGRRSTQESPSDSPATGATAATASPGPRFITRTPVASRP